VDATAMTMDLFPTCLELAGVELPTSDSPNTLDGVSLAPLLLENKPLPERTLFWRMRGQKAVRRGPWKLVTLPDSKPELYNLADDLGETRNVAANHAEVVNSLRDELARWETLMKRKTD
jgi:arylsulfatase